MFVERNVIDLDPGDDGTLSNDNTIEVRADFVVVLEVGPMSLNVALADSTQGVEVEFQAMGKTLDGADRPVARFSYKADDQDVPRRWKIFTGDPDFKVEYKQRVRVVVKGSIFARGMEWVGPWNQGLGNGPLMVSVPTADDPTVTRRSLDDAESAGASVGVMPPPPAISASPGRRQSTTPKAPAAIGAPPFNARRTRTGWRGDGERIHA